MNRRTLRIVALPVAAILCLATIFWPQVQGVATILLLSVTFEYVLLTQENIELFRRQLERQEKVYVNFELICRNGPLFVRVANLGVSNFLVSAIHVRAQDIEEFHYHTQEVVASGKVVDISLPREACAGRSLSVDLEVTLECVGQDVRANSEPQVFNVGMGLDDIPNSTKRGLDAMWSITCPKCQKAYGGLLLMSVRGLKTFADAFARKKQILEDFRTSCPDHKSQFLLTIDEANERR